MSTNNYKFKQTEIEEIPENWEILELDSLLNKKNQGVNTTTEKVSYSKSGVPIIRANNITDYSIDFEDLVYVDSDNYSRIRIDCRPKNGDILYTNIGSQFGSAVLVKNDKEFGIAWNVMRMQPNIEKIVPGFLVYLLNNPKNKFEIKSLNSSSTMPFVSGGELGKTKFIIPTIQEQKNIASILSSLDDKIELNQKTIKTLEEIGQALFKRWFVDFEFPNEKGEPYKSSGGEMVDSELGEIPRSWSVKKISDFGKVICGKTPSKDKDEYFNGDTPFIKIPDMHGNIYITETTDSLTNTGANSQPSKYLPKNSICVSCIATVGLVSLTSKQSQTNQQINSLIPNEEHYKEYLFFTLKNNYDFLNNLASGGSATLNMNTQTFSNIEIRKPNKELLLLFHENLNPIFEKILSLQKENISLKNTRDSLLPKLLSGKIRV